MCETCGCGESSESVTIRKPGMEDPEHHHPHEHHHDHPHSHPPPHHDEPSRTIKVEQDVLSKNNLIAERNRGWLEAKNILALNLISSPGAGKTTLLEKTISRLKDRISIAVIEGDQQTTRDAQRIETAGARSMQVNTGMGCHLDADMIHRAIHQLEPDPDSLLFIENVGNLVCPALFDLGEREKILVTSVTEGEDKPLKYAPMFAVSDLCIINKTDLLAYVDFDIAVFRQYATRVNPKLQFFELSAITGEGLEKWTEWVLEQTAHP
jgi:hydrogenase nickel incorporation protein HypB